jgi:hypothetical protein
LAVDRITVVDVTVPDGTGVVVALTVCDIPFACTDCPDLTALKELKELTVLGFGIDALLPPPPLHAVNKIPPITEPSRKYIAALPFRLRVLARPGHSE